MTRPTSQQFNSPAATLRLAKLALSWGVCAALLSACGGGTGSTGLGSNSPSPAAPVAQEPAASTPQPETVKPDPTPDPKSNPAPQGAPLTASAPGSLVEYFKQKIKQSAADPAPTPAPTALPVGAVASPESAAASGNANFSSSTVQERGVDENDWLKTDGQTVYALAKSYANRGVLVPAQVQAQKVQAGGQLAALAQLNLPTELTYSGMYLVSSASRLALLGQKFTAVGPVPLPAPAPGVGAPPRDALHDPGGSAASGSGWAARRLFEANSSAIGEKNNAADRPSPLDRRPQGVVQSVPSLSLAPMLQARSIGIDLMPLASNLATSSTLSSTWNIKQRIRIDGTLVGSRVIGSTLYVVSNHQPSLAMYAIAPNSTAAQADTVLANLTAQELLPKVTIDDQAPEPLMAETDCYVQAGNASLDRQITTITAFDLASNSLQRSSRCFLGGSQALYVSPAAVYIASSRFSSLAANLPTSQTALNSRTDIHKFALSGRAIAYRGSGEVAGHLGWDADKNAYRMSEHEGDLRILTFTGQQGWSVARNGSSTVATPVPGPSPATLSVLREAASGTALQVLATLPNAQRPAPLGKPGEQIFAVQFAGPRAYLVTFRQTDPLYLIDLANPLDPKTLSELALPGYSDYLYPLGDALLLGVGKDANAEGVLGGVKLALIDISNPALPSLKASAVLGQRGSASALDFSSRGINIFEESGVFRIALPVRFNETPLPRSPGFFAATRQGLARFEVNTAAKTLNAQAVVVGLSFTEENSAAAFGQYDLAQERSVQIGAGVYYFSGGKLLASRW